VGDVAPFPVISADSHITEAPNTYTEYIDPAWRDRAPHMVDGGEGVGDLFVIDGMDRPVPMGLVAAAGKPPEEIRVMGVKFADLHRGGWDPEARLADQQRDGVAAEIIYPTVGMQLCNHRDFDFKKACFDAYNRWIAEYCDAHPDRLLGCGQTAMRSPEEGIEDLTRIKELGLRGVMMPGEPAMEDYDSEIYDPFWEAAVAMELPL
jgi:predicted TIM-barrel fold metal-dependent hydrolase